MSLLVHPIITCHSFTDRHFPHEGFFRLCFIEGTADWSMWEHVGALEDRRILHSSIYLSCGSLARVGVLECLA
jgi:hypothetical protein